MILQKFGTALAVTTATIHGGHVLAVPLRHEAAALTATCPDCAEPAEPASVLDQVKGMRTTSRLATYRCRGCAAAWLREWTPPGRTVA